MIKLMTVWDKFINQTIWYSTVPRWGYWSDVFSCFSSVTLS